MESQTTHILIVDDEPEILKSCEKILRYLDAKIDLVTSGREAQQKLESEQYDVIVCDLKLPDIYGLQLLEIARRFHSYTPFIVFTAFGTIERAVEAMKMGAFDFIQKPFTNDLFQLAIERALRHRRLLLRNLGLEQALKKRYRFESMIGVSPKMHQIFELIQRVAPTNTNVLIVGESGTGKELVARCIHNKSERRKKPFVPVNCSALPENLFESELFGHEKGSFTGAIRQKKGLLEYASGGTFFMDEVFELPQNLQIKLLRMLQDKTIWRVGGDKEIPVDVRIISATNRDVEKALKNGQIRDDFYYRLAVIVIEMPPLRERKEDIPILTQHFIQEYAQMLSKPVKGISSQALTLLENYNWPGNVRELQNVIERAVTLTTTDQIVAENLPENLLAQSAQPFIAFDKGYQEARKELLNQFDRTYLVQLLQKFRGNISLAAQESGLNRRSIHRMLSRLNIDPKLFREK